MRLTSIFAAGGAVVISAVVLLMPWPFAPTRWFDTLENGGHVVFFGLLAWWTVRVRLENMSSQVLYLRIYLWVWFAITLLGGVVELLQGLTGRDPSFNDLLNDGLGAGLALVSHAKSSRALPDLSRRVRAVIVWLSVLALTAVLMPFAWTTAAYWQRWQQLPVLWQYRSPLDLYFTHYSRARLRPPQRGDCAPGDAAVASGQAMALRVPLDEEHYPGFNLDEVAPDWRGYRTVSVAFINPGKVALPITVRVHDRQHQNRVDDRFNRSFVVPPGPYTLTVPVQDIEHGPTQRLLDLGHIAGFMVFTAKGSIDAALCLVSISLLH